MKIYLDTSSLQRPLDNRNQIRVNIEAEAVLGILSLFESGQVELISSEALLFEIERNPNMARQEYALDVLSKATTVVMVTDEIERRAREFIALGVKPLDALHLASAEQAPADLFCTCDDRLLRKAKSLALRIRVMSPVDVIEEMNK